MSNCIMRDRQTNMHTPALGSGCDGKVLTLLPLLPQLALLARCHPARSRSHMRDARTWAGVWGPRWEVDFLSWALFHTNVTAWLWNWSWLVCSWHGRDTRWHLSAQMWPHVAERGKWAASCTECCTACSGFTEKVKSHVFFSRDS